MSHATRALARRQFLQTTLCGGAALTGLVPGRANAAENPASLNKGSVILFQGDSITDARRDRGVKEANNPNGLGNGYAFLLACGLLRDHAAAELKVLNRGVSGNKVPDLEARWQEDCLALKPAVLSVLIGVNDIWHKLNGRYEGTVEEYHDGLLNLLRETRSALPDTRVIVCEPFVLRCGAVNEQWFPEFDQRRQAARDVATKLNLTLVSFQTMFDEATAQAPPAYWAADGVHPTLAGHALMAQTWRQVTGL